MVNVANHAQFLPDFVYYANSKKSVDNLQNSEIQKFGLKLKDSLEFGCKFAMKHESPVFSTNVRIF